MYNVCVCVCTSSFFPVLMWLCPICIYPGDKHRIHITYIFHTHMLGDDNIRHKTTTAKQPWRTTTCYDKV